MEKRRPAFSGYRPQFYYEDEDWDAEHTYLGVEQVNPGDTVTARLTFTRPDLHLGRIHVGTEFLIREGVRTRSATEKSLRYSTWSRTLQENATLKRSGTHDMSVFTQHAAAAERDAAWWCWPWEHGNLTDSSDP